MAKAFSLASWNVEHFRSPDSRVGRVVDFLVDLGPPDVFALYEVEGKEVFDALVTKMPGYTFHITEGPQSRRSCSAPGRTSPPSSRNGPSSSPDRGRSAPVRCGRSGSTAKSTRSCSCTRRAGSSRLDSGCGTTC
jgi:hypothetical protein